MPTSILEAMRTHNFSIHKYPRSRSIESEVLFSYMYKIKFKQAICPPTRDRNRKLISTKTDNCSLMYDNPGILPT